MCGQTTACRIPQNGVVVMEHDEDYDEDNLGDVYSEGMREQQLEEDEISAEEEAFMRGWEEAG